MATIIRNALLLYSAIFMFNCAQASTIPGLFNTGAGINIDKQTDLNYKLTDSSGKSIYGGYGETAVGNGGYIGKLLLGDDNASHWLTPTANRSQSFDPIVDGIYKWTIDFSLAGFNPNTASFSGLFAADNYGIAYLNGHEIGRADGYAAWYNFSASNNLFVKGDNELQFVVTNYHQRTGNPTGLRVEFTNSNVSTVPIPGALWLFGSALAGLVGFGKRKQGQMLQA